MPAGERRQVTVLYADLSGYTKLSSEIDPEESHALLSRFFEVVDGIVATYGGTIDKHIGDAVMALFGAPVAHSDDPQRAARAALAMHEAMPALSAELRRPIQIHIGIASGEVVASGTGSRLHSQYTVTGATANLAARLHDLAEAGETLVTDAVYHAISVLAACEPRGEVAVKGLAKPVRVFRLVGMRNDVALPSRTPFVGRLAEIEAFVRALEACRASGSGQVLLVRGEAGIGKSRLVGEFAAAARARGFADHKGLVLDFGVGKGQDAICAVVRSVLGLRADADEAQRRAAVDAALAAGLLDENRRVFLNDLVDVPQPPELRALYNAMDTTARDRDKRATVGEVMTAASRRQPVLLVIEDLHWADAGTLAHLASLAGIVKDCPVVLVMTTRLEGDPSRDAWRDAPHVSALTIIVVPTLRRDEATLLAVSLIGASDRITERCVERAGGSPLFLEQLLRNAEESLDDALPGSIQSLVLARIDRLPAPDKQAVQAASVIGQRFGIDLLRHLLGIGDFRCDHLVAHHLIRPEEDGFLFTHALIQEGVYGSLLKSKRRELHRRAAAWFAGRDPILHAEHLDRADDPAAPRAYLEAARAQAAAFHQEHALRLAECGLDLVRIRAERYELAHLRGELLRDLGAIDQSIEAFNQALEVAADERQRCQTWIGIAAGMRIANRRDEALTHLDQAERVAVERDFAGELAEIHHCRGNIYFVQGQIDGCLEQHERALAQARRAGSAEAEARALGGLGDAYYLCGRMVTARDQFDRCVEVCRANGFVGIEVANLYMRGITRAFCNDLVGGLEDGLDAAETAAKIGNLRAEMVARCGVCAFILYELGELDRMPEQIERAWDLIRRIGARHFEANIRMYLGQMMTAQGRPAEAMMHLEEGVAVCRETGIRFAGPAMFGALAVAAEDARARARALGEGEAILRDGCASHNYLWFYRDAIDVALAMGDWDRSEGYAAALEAYTRPEPLPVSAFVIARGRALARYGRGSRDAETLTELRRLTAEAERVGLRMALPALRKALREERDAVNEMRVVGSRTRGKR